APPRLEQLYQLRDLVHDYLRPGRLRHEFLVRLERRRPDRHLDWLAGPLRPGVTRGLLNGRVDLRDADRGWTLLVVSQARGTGLELDHGLVQHRRPGGDRGRGGLR